MYDAHSKKSNNNFTKIIYSPKTWEFKTYHIVLEKITSASGSNLSVATNLYNRAKLLSTQIEGEDIVYFFVLKRSATNKNLAVFHCHSTDGQLWHSPYKAPFGGIDQAPDCPAEAIAFLLDCIEEFIGSQGGKALQIKLPASIYEGINLDVYQAAGYTLQKAHTNFFLQISETPFDRIIKSQERRRLAKARRENFTAEVWKGEPIEVFRFIEKSRNQYGYTMSVTEAQVKKLMDNFPENYVPFCVKHNDEIAAICLTVLTNPHTLYTFLPANLPQYKSISPMVILHENMYNYCQKHNIRYLDLGTSLDETGEIKPSLAKFKLNLGAESCEKPGIVKYF